MGCGGAKMIPVDQHVQACIDMLNKRPVTKNFRFNLENLKIIDKLYSSNVFGGSIFLPIGSADRRAALRYKTNNLEEDLRAMQVNYLYGGGFYVITQVRHCEKENLDSKEGALFSDIHIMVEAIDDLKKLEQLKIFNDLTAEERKGQKPLLFKDIKDQINGFGRIIEYRIFSSDMSPEQTQIERIKEGRFKGGKADGYGRRLSVLAKGTCFVGFWKEGKADGKFEVYDSDGYALKYGVFSGDDCLKNIEINNFQTRVIKTGALNDKDSLNQAGMQQQVNRRTSVKAGELANKW